MFSAFKIVDLTHKLNRHTVSWNGGCGFHLDIKHDYTDAEPGETGFRVQQIKMHAGIGTHIDAPLHCVPHAKSVADLELQHLMTHCIMIDLSSQADANFSVAYRDILYFESQHGKITPNSFVIIYTGWENYWSSPERYRNHYRFPSIGREAIAYLLEKDIAGIGIDTLSPDRPADGFPVHEQMLGAGKYIIENVANACQLPPTGSYSLALPINITASSEAPIRLVALVDNGACPLTPSQ